ncbi:Lrp/AsnC family transcriptional regulator [Komagataeibacter sp. AV436]|uniref:Lrp/AsnC family transcriptional regulator n=1 Tax=Komagataeibacter melomenusus TaxID=2766578 RepID=A0ABX2AHI5_9PROT|nr:Lrp/AsnC family transcriptional regulator [Komagataeibacter melomenusus]MBV1829037.1 Lrp/AsnC family transcriptional regulator [Komagataeibacter melomenusus]NPC67101.1 Lrp/AsnC family transcriptional regulator [Komagataeibacter melomenusus]
MAENRFDLDGTSRQILRELQKNASLTNQELAERVGISPSPCWRRVSELRGSGVITRTVTLLDPDRLGLSVSVFVHLSLQRQDQASLKEFETQISQRSEIMECYLMTGESDYMLRIVVHDIREFRDFMIGFLTTLPNVSNLRSSFALSQIKYTTALPV